MKIFKLLFILLILIVFTVDMQAAYTVFKSVPFTARVSVLGSTNYNFGFLVINRFTLIPTTNIAWTNINVQNLGANKLRVANQYVQLNYTNGAGNWGIDISSWNTNGVLMGGAANRYTGPVANAAGLVQTNNTVNALQLVWQVQDSVSYPANVPAPIITQAVAGAFTNYGWNWKYLLDREQPAWLNTSVNSNVGASEVNYYAIPIYDNHRLVESAAGSDSRTVTSSPDYIFFGADFTAASPAVYKTTALIIEMYKP